MGVEETATEPSFWATNQAQPEPKRVMDAFLNSSLKASNEPNLASIAFPKVPTGAPPPVGDKIFQMVIIPHPIVELIEVDELSDSERGEGGFGSTGK